MQYGQLCLKNPMPSFANLFKYIIQLSLFHILVRTTQTGKQRVSGSYKTAREEAPGPPRNAAWWKGDACDDHGRALCWLPPGLPASSLGTVKRSGSESLLDM